MFKVMHLGTKEYYALKLIELGRVSKLNKLHEVLFETKTLQKMNHPGIVKFIESFQKDNYMMIILELGPHGDMFSFISIIHSLPDLH